MKFSWLEPLYTEGISEKQARRNQVLVNRNCPVDGLWLVTLPAGGRNQLELYPVYALQNLHFPYEEIWVLGMAMGRKKAAGLAARMVDEAWRATGSFQVREYYQKKTAEED